LFEGREGSGELLDGRKVVHPRLAGLQVDCGKIVALGWWLEHVSLETGHSWIKEESDVFICLMFDKCRRNIQSDRFIVVSQISV
jgi:hypothetical protein